MKFTKMHGIGNDYIYINCFEETVADPSALARRLSDRHFGVGGDGVILIMPSKTADVRMSMYNADGSEGLMCGNGIRCVGKYAYDHGLVGSNRITVETGSGTKALEMELKDGKVITARVNMGEPILAPHDIPMISGLDRFVQQPVTVNSIDLLATAVSMGNPHWVFFMEEIEHLDLPRIGPAFEYDPRFPSRVNTEFVQVIARNEVKMRVWERGSGETLACGTGACAVAVAGVLAGLTDRRIAVHLAGGDLMIDWAQDGCVYMTGPAQEVFTGEVTL